MDTVAHEGKEYKKVALLAKEFGYTTDYIGQLCRAGKVRAKLVGRAWYVDPDSLTEHKKGRYQETFHKRIAEAEKDDKPRKHYLDRVDVESVRTNKTSKVIRHIKGEFQEVAVRYESDDGTLIPKVLKQERSDPVEVDLADAKSIKIKKSNTTPNVTLLEPEELPTVYMKGKLPVTDVHEKASVTVKSAKDTPQVAQTVKVRTFSKPTPTETKSRKVKTLPSTYPRKGLKQSYLGKSQEEKQPLKPVEKINFQPKSLSNNNRASVLSTPDKKVRTKQSQGNLLATVLLLCFAIAIAVFLLATERTLLVEKDTTNSSLNFDSNQLKNLFNQ